MMTGDGTLQWRLDELSMPMPVQLSHPPIAICNSSKHDTCCQQFCKYQILGPAGTGKFSWDWKVQLGPENSVGTRKLAWDQIVVRRAQLQANGLWAMKLPKLLQCKQNMAKAVKGCCLFNAHC